MINNKKRSNTFQVDSFSKSKDSQKNIKKDQKEKLNKKFGDFKDDFNVQPERSFLKIGEKSSNDNIQKTKLEFQKIWERPKALPFSEIGPEFEFQMVDTDYQLEFANKNFSESHKDHLPVIRIFGVTKNENSVCCKVHGFYPYFHLQQPPEVKTPRDLHDFIQTIENAFETTNKYKLKDKCIMKYETKQSQSVYGYSNKTNTAITIYLSQPRLIPVMRSLLEETGISYKGIFKKYPTFETNFLFVLRFMTDVKMTGFSWIKIKNGSFAESTRKISSCQYEIDVNYKDLDIQSLEINSTMAPLRILSFDIECKAKPGHFPKADADPIIMIACSLLKHGEKKTTLRNLFTFKDCGVIDKQEDGERDKKTNKSPPSVHVYKDESEMLLAFRDFIITLDPDVMTGYNISSFDFPYIIDRCDALDISLGTYFSRVKNVECKVKRGTFESRAYGQLEKIEINIDGRNQFDLLTYMRKAFKLPSYTLNAVSKHFLDKEKEDVHHSQIAILWMGSIKQRNRLARYCIKDTILPIKLIVKLNSLTEMTEMSRVTNVPLNLLVQSGASIKSVALLFSRAKEKGYMIPATTTEKNKKKYEDFEFEGATVVEPKKGFYDCTINTLDFASLYPSIMIAHNLCYTTLIENYSEERLKELGLTADQVTRTPQGFYFVKSSCKKGLLPQILEYLLSERSKAKRLMFHAKTETEKAIYNNRQICIKLSANSIYGFTGAVVGKLPCLEIGTSVTGFGRTMIEQVKNAVETTYRKENGYPGDAEVIYGDTDSVFVNFNCDFITSCELGKEAACEISKLFISPIKLEWEKCYKPYLLIKKKRYAGRYWTNAICHDKIDTKGIETVRRDNCTMLKNLLLSVLDEILLERNIENAQELVRQVTAKLMRNEISISDLIISKNYSKAEEQYVAQQPHIEVSKKRQKRNPDDIAIIGDRIRYIVCEGSKKDKVCMKAEDPLYVLENNIPIDFPYYLEKQLTNPIKNIFAPIIGEKKALALINGDHNRTHIRSTPNAPQDKSGLMRFVVKSDTCMKCKMAIEKGSMNKAFCGQCLEDDDFSVRPYLERALKNVEQAKEKSKEFFEICQKCQGFTSEEIICNSQDCEVFYKRNEANKKQKDMEEFLCRFNNLNII